jgi:predicted transcriptional regulator
MSNQLTKLVKEGYLLRYMMRGVLTVRLLSMIAVFSIISGYWLSIDDSSSTEEGYDDDFSEFMLADSTESQDENSDGQHSNEETAATPSESDLPGNLIIGGASTLGSLLMGSVLFEFVKVTVLMALFSPLLAKLNSTRDDLLTRGRILGYLEGNAGIHFSALRDALGLANGVTAYHLQVLESKDQVISWRDGKLRRYAISSLSNEEIGLIKSPIIGTRLAILDILSDSGALGLSGTEIRKKILISRQLLSHHLSELRKADIIEPSSEKKRPNWRLSATGQEVLDSSRKLSITEAAI